MDLESLSSPNLEAAQFPIRDANQARQRLDGDGRSADHKAVVLRPVPPFKFHAKSRRHFVTPSFSDARKQHQGAERKVDELQLRQDDSQEVHHELEVERVGGPDAGRH